MTWWPQLLPAVAAMAVMACSSGAPDLSPDPGRVRLLGALPPAAAAQGVYVVDLQRAGEQSPGSRLAPLVGSLVDDAQLMVEATAPPVTLLGGIDKGARTPDDATRVGDVIVVGEPSAREAVAERLEQESAPAAALAELAGSVAPVAWTGPTPAPDGSGTTTVTLSPEQVRFAAAVDGDLPAAEEQARRELDEGGPTGSPGKPWRSILEDADVTRDGDRLVVTARPTDLPGLFFRVLIDQRQVSFLSG